MLGVLQKTNSKSKICFYQKIHNFHQITMKLGHNDIHISPEFRDDWKKIADFSIKAYF